MDESKTLDWRPRARERFRLIITDIKRHNPIAAESLARLISRKLRMALAFPMLYRASARVPGVREIVVTANYIVPYRITESKLQIVDIVHARRDWPNPPQLVSRSH